MSDPTRFPPPGYKWTSSDLSTNYKCVHGGLHGDFKWPYEIPIGPFGPWSPQCESELLKPEPCAKPNPAKPCNFKDVIALLSDVLLAVETLCPDIPPAGDPGRPEWIDPRLLAISYFLQFDWLRATKECNAELQTGIYHYVFVILCEAFHRGTYKYFTEFPALMTTLDVLRKNFDNCSWGELFANIEKIARIIFDFGPDKAKMAFQLEIQITGSLDGDWIEKNNQSLLNAQNYSLAIALDYVGKNLSLTDTLKGYCNTDGVLRFKIIRKQCKNAPEYNLAYGNQKFTARNPVDFKTICLAVFSA